MCVIVYTEINGKKILAKNRDRTYKPVIEIIHEVVDGLEVAYIKDTNTGWIEGMNENGVGLVNSTLSSTDSKMDIPIIKKEKKGKSERAIKKRNVMYKALINKGEKNNFYDIIKHADKKYILEGHTILFHDNTAFHIENNKENNFIAKKINKTSVFSNHGIQLKKEGYTRGCKGLSTFLRSDIVKEELHKHEPSSILELVKMMNNNYLNINPRFHPYRDRAYTLKKNKDINRRSKVVNTTGQLVLNMTDKEMFYFTDVHNSKYVTYVSNLPKNYNTKIRITIQETEKKIRPSKKIFSQKYLNKLYHRFHCNTNRKSKSVKNTTRRQKKISK